MNKQLQEFAEQAKKYALDAMIKITDKEQALKVYSETYDTKFSKLIVGECCAEIRKQDLPIPVNSYWVNKIAEHIERHFNINE